jgi:hypothetical protein
MPPTCGSALGRGPPNGVCASKAWIALSSIKIVSAAPAHIVRPRAQPE